jgi:hypothetical protein
LKDTVPATPTFTKDVLQKDKAGARRTTAAQDRE